MTTEEAFKLLRKNKKPGPVECLLAKKKVVKAKQRYLPLCMLQSDNLIIMSQGRIGPYHPKDLEIGEEELSELLASTTQALRSSPHSFK